MNQPDPCTGTVIAPVANSPSQDVLTAHHCVEVLRSKFHGTAVIPTEHSPKKPFAPPPGTEVCGSTPAKGYLKSSTFFLSDSTQIGFDIAVIKFPLLTGRKALELEDPKSVKGGDTIYTYGFGYSDCDKDPKAVRKSGISLMRKGEFKVAKNDTELGAIVLDPLGKDGAMTCAGDSGVGYLVKRQGNFKVVAVHKGKPDRLQPTMYGTQIDTRFVCKVFQNAGFKNPFCAPR